MKVIVGLGNPGEKYKNTRHNVGFMTVDSIAKENDLSWQFNKKLNATIAKENDFLLVKPQSFMNKSGQVVQAVLSYYNLLPKKMGFLKTKDSNLTEILTIIHDDLDIDLGKYKIALESSSAGHKGVADIINHLKTKKFRRFRIGIKNQNLEKIKPEKFVLQKFNKEEEEILEREIKNITSLI